MQIVPFSDLKIYQFASSLPYIYLKYTITSEDLTSPSRFVIDFTSIGKMVELRNISSPHGLRIYTLDNHCRLVKDVPPYTEIWDTEAYSAQIGLHSSILTHAAGFSVKVGQGRKMPVCTDESGMNGSDIIFDVYLLGPCANANMNVQEVRFLVIHSIHRSRSCCRFDGYITMHPVGAVALSLKEARTYKGHVSNVWHTPYRDANVKFWVMCTQLCLKILIELHVDRSTLKTFSVGYQAKLIEQNDLFDVAFTKTLFRSGYKSPRLGLITWHQLCFNHHCYFTPKNQKASTWDQAKTACEEEGAYLVSINSALEWALLTRIPQQKEEAFIELYNIRDAILIYIGLVTDVSTNAPS